MFEEPVFDHRESIASCHHVWRQHHLVNHLILDGFIDRNAAFGAKDAEAFDAMLRWFGEVKFYTNSCWRKQRHYQSESDVLYGKPESKNRERSLQLLIHEEYV